jgi:hypothetical protein
MTKMPKMTKIPKMTKNGQNGKKCTKMMKEKTKKSTLMMRSMPKKTPTNDLFAKFPQILLLFLSRT